MGDPSGGVFKSTDPTDRGARSVRSVLFVCLGNICRSPTAESVLQTLVVERGLQGQVHADSAGTGRYHIGEPADLRMQETASRRGYVLASVARQVTREDFERFGLIVAMDRENLRDLRDLEPRPRGQVKLFSDFLPLDYPRDVPDPYLGEAGFDRALDIIEHGCPAILDDLMRGS